MCGALVERRSQERRTQAAEQPPVSALVNAQLPAPEIPVATVPEPAPSAVATEPIVEVPPARAAAPARRAAPARPRGIGGPSFLGLNDDAAHSGEYLLDDDQSSGGVIRKLVLVTLLAVIAGSAFVYWRSSLRAALKPREPVKTQQASATAQSSSSGANDTASSTGTQPTDSSPSSSDAKPVPDSTPAAAAANEAADKQPAPATQPDASKSPAPTETAETTPSFKEKAAARQKQKAAEDTQAKPSAALLKAQQLLQSTGNCEQGLVYLRAAAQKNEPAAAVQMSNLYATGHCVLQDRVMAYRWLNSAHELAPGNASIQTSIDVLWGQMTSQERRQASR